MATASAQAARARSEVAAALAAVEARLVEHADDPADAKAAVRDAVHGYAKLRVASDLTGGGSIFTRQRVRIGERMRSGVPPVRFLPSPTLGERLFYAHGLFLLAGHKKAGKSWCMAVQAADVLAAGAHVVYIDQENGEDLFVERMLSLGVDPDAADDRFVYVPFPEEKPSLDSLRAEIESIAQEFPGAFIVLDSLRTFMSRYGLNPNADVEVEQLLGPIMGAVKNLPEDRRVTVGIIDHSNRSTKEGDEYAAGGSQAKAAAVDAVYFFKREERFSEEVEGLVKIVAVDDRRGRLDFGRYYRVGGQGEGRSIRFKRVDSDDVGTMGKARESVLDFLMDNDGEWLTPSKVVDSAATTGKTSDLRRALESLAAGHPHVHSRPNPRRRDSTVYSFDPSIEKNHGGLEIA